jgi:hypothetical protein
MVRGFITTEFNYPVLRWDRNGQPQPVLILCSAALPEHYARIDAFEGKNYRRILVPVEIDSGNLQVCNLYAKNE